MQDFSTDGLQFLDLIKIDNCLPAAFNEF